LASLKAWIGREDHASGRLDEALARRWLATFDLDALAQGAMPQGIHWCLCTPETASERLGPDGHPLRDGASDSFLPPVAAPRRMWAGSACEFHAPIAIGSAITRTSRIAAIEEKHGSTGPLTFVTILHETSADGTLAVTERQTLVYRDPPPRGAPPAPPLPRKTRFDDGDWDAVSRLTPTPQLLFRYSALTFNTHLIHYDADYVRAVEGYRGIIVHAPLMASLLLQLAAREFGANVLGHFAFRGVSPAIAHEELVLALRGGPKNSGAIELGAFAADGRQVLAALASR
jgi:3-methylfumaryl-CoA hydratase